MIGASCKGKPFGSSLSPMIAYVALRWLGSTLHAKRLHFADDTPLP
jgi:hypothetical protein